MAAKSRPASQASVDWIAQPRTSPARGGRRHALADPVERPVAEHRAELGMALLRTAVPLPELGCFVLLCALRGEDEQVGLSGVPGAVRRAVRRT
ncbi:hypothetical protein [Streptacidiphilus sp. MAP12-33]|uniref:hypothetical protein n=1 Tax=Streptacidiphilus sp. MAP12-33 TaxID=3156266 RepID=UPI003518F340